MFQNLIKLLEIVIAEGAKLGLSQKIYVVGGAARDLLRGERDLSDIDFVTTASINKLVERVVSKTNGVTKFFPKFLTAKIVEPSLIGGFKNIDFASARSEIYPLPGSLPKVSLAEDIAEDLRRRDFSINAIAIEIESLYQALQSGNLKADKLVTIDPYWGINDLRDKILRILHPKSFIDDPTRILRGFRYMVRFNLTFEKITERLLLEAIELNVFETISEFRKFAEIKKIFSERELASFPRLFDQYKIWFALCPNKPKVLGKFIEAMRVIFRDQPLLTAEERERLFLVATKLFWVNTGELKDQFDQLGLSKSYKKKIDDLISNPNQTDATIVMRNYLEEILAI
ncbi:MAG TPA: hypothetical protein PKD37_00960 [Oligoflexia bacterium]|nr:hypothetical protein [Oligoflexia bacterium]HMP26549.1 hypothetical protein [Oligoflexia bacterium]